MLKKRWLKRQGFEIFNIQSQENRVLLRIVVLCGVLTAEHAALLEFACQSLDRGVLILLRVYFGPGRRRDLETRIVSCKEILSSALQEHEKVKALSSILNRIAPHRLGSPKASIGGVSTEEQACLASPLERALQSSTLKEAIAQDELHVPWHISRKHC